MVILLAKALAGGDGYRLISSATTPVMPSVPPGFPAVLAPVFLIAPTFPDNLALLKLISIAAMAGVGAYMWIDFTRHRGVPGGTGTVAGWDRGVDAGVRVPGDLDGDGGMRFQRGALAGGAPRSSA